MLWSRWLVASLVARIRIIRAFLSILSEHSHAITSSVNDVIQSVPSQVAITVVTLDLEDRGSWQCSSLSAQKQGNCARMPGPCRAQDMVNSLPAPYVILLEMDSSSVFVDTGVHHCWPREPFREAEASAGIS